MPLRGCGIVYWWVPSGASAPAPMLTSGWNVFSAPSGGRCTIRLLNAALEYGVMISLPAPPAPPASAVPVEQPPPPAPPGWEPADPAVFADGPPAPPAPPPVTAAAPLLVGAPSPAG